MRESQTMAGGLTTALTAGLKALDPSTSSSADGYSPLATSSDVGTPPASPAKAGGVALPVTPTEEELEDDKGFPAPLSSSILSPRVRHVRRALFVGLFFLITVTLYFLLPTSLTPSSLSSLPTVSLSSSFPFISLISLPSCTSRAYSSGRWVPKNPSLRGNTSEVDVLTASGFQGCTQDWFKPAWYLGSKESDWHGMDEYRWRAAQWQWEAEDEVCQEEVKRTEAEELIAMLVERGGWMLLGDSLSEQHFFSLGCTLFPHVEVRWGEGWWEQLMFLRPDSPLATSLSFPPAFSISSTPLITNLRTDHGFSKDELRTIYESTPQAALIPSSKLFTDYPVQSPPVEEYLDRFFSHPSTTGNWSSSERYQALLFSTAAHFTPREFAFPGGQPEIAPFFEAVVANWSSTVVRYLSDDGAGREVLVRSATSGHDKCKTQFAPFEDEWPAPKSYNWARIPEMNDVFEAELEKAVHPRLNFLSLDRPAQLRPDAHAADCLHVAVGTGIFEGFTDYLSYWLQRR
ncbi:hypothetical protein JCM6882_000189 [Rhodosporidiobolus microsporus]